MNKANCYWRVLVRENNRDIFCPNIALCTKKDWDFIHLNFYLDAIEVQIAKVANVLEYNYNDFVNVFEKLGFEKEGEEYIDYAQCEEDWYLNTYFLVKESHDFTFEELIEFLRKLTKELNAVEGANIRISNKIGLFETDENFNEYYADFEVVDFWY